MEATTKAQEAKGSVVIAAADIIRVSAVQEIARRFCGVEVLTERGQDSLDFHAIGVVSLRRALEAAYEAGAKANGGAR